MFITSSCLLTLIIACVRATDDFEDLKFETEVEMFNDQYFENGNHIFQWQSLNGTIILERDLLLFKCSTVSNIPFNSVYRPFNIIMRPKKLIIKDCALPATLLADVLKQANIEVTTIQFLQIAITNMTEALPAANYMEGLNLTTLFVETLNSKNIFEKTPDLLKPLTNLTTLIVRGTEVPKIPDNMQLKVLSLRDEASMKKWPDCKHLKTLSIRNVKNSQLPTTWPIDCVNLNNIILRNMTADGSRKIVEAISASAGNVVSLYMQYSNLTSPPYLLLNSARHLRHLNLTGNKLTDQTLIDVPVMENLTNLDLSYNLLRGTGLFQIIKKIPAIEYLNLDGNKLFDTNFCNSTVRKSFASQLTSLKRLSLKNASITPHCFKDNHFSKLEYLNLASSDKTDMINLRHFMTTNSKNLEVDLRGRSIKWIQFDDNDYLALRKKNYVLGINLWGYPEGANEQEMTHLTVLLSSLECDCRNYWFRLALRDFSDLINSPHLKCSNSGDNFLERSFESLKCPVEFKDECVIRKQVEGSKMNGTIVKCLDEDFVDFKKFDNEWNNIIGADFRNNRIRTLKVMSFPDSLEWMDLRDNQISSLDISELSRMFKSPRTRVRLNGNPFTCDCALVTTLYETRDVIADYEEIFCADRKTLVHTLKTEEVCNETGSNYTWLAVASVAIILQMIFLSWYYSSYFLKNCCLCYRRDKTDAEAWNSSQLSKIKSTEVLVSNSQINEC